ncbi:SUMO-activating enzyme subunit 2 [Halyomorpha halys]|uniref:SUMO-activating enzyme subunit 2 n=1 Tax=Halyomorpha halys TaxID=286706 RepID=UPI0006D50D61|nr:SUMO-activating enzyme subunit 2 [Halyomorpha halys]
MASSGETEVIFKVNNNMTNTSPLIFDSELKKVVNNSKVLVVGAGGIGCELLKNLVLTGFEDIEIIDLDTIDVSNLNRQFLFQKKHVGKSKAEVAKQSVLQFNPNAKIIAHHASVTGPDFGVRFIQKFNVVMNALDNKAARNHVNRLCLAAGVPLIESGTAGYSGQVELIVKQLTKCYECDPKANPKTFPGCTIRNTPSLLIHCIVWAKHLFSQLFGEQDPREEDFDVSPDPTDAESGGDPNPETPRLSTREWAKQVGYEPQQLFTKLFEDDIQYLLTLKGLWEDRRPPTPLKWNEALEIVDNILQPDNQNILRDQKIWNLSECVKIFQESLSGLKKGMEENNSGFLVWDKDDKPSMDFVASVANIRAHIFGIPVKSRFDIKSMAGNIIPAIATSNAVIAGLVVLNALNVLRGKMEQCQSVYLRKLPNPRNVLIVREKNLEKPNPKCCVCSEKPQVTIATDLMKMKLKDFESLVLKEKLNMIEPDVQRDSTGCVIISSEEGETDHNNDKTLKELGISDGTILLADDFVQNYQLRIIMTHRELGREDPPFFIAGDPSELKPQKEEEVKPDNGPEKNGGDNDEVNIIDDDDELMIIEEEEEDSRKRKNEDRIPVPVKKRRTEDLPNNFETNETIHI